MFLAKPLGLLALLDEESRFPGASEQSFISKLFSIDFPYVVFSKLYYENLIFVFLFFLEKLHNNIRSDYFIKHKSNGLEFTVQHYAGRVTYDASCLLDKNRNFFPPEVIQLLRTSSDPIGI
jgi:myosin-3